MHGLVGKKVLIFVGLSDRETECKRPCLCKRAAAKPGSATPKEVTKMSILVKLYQGNLLR